MPKKWEVKTIYDATDAEIADMLNEGWKLLGMCSYTEASQNVYTDQIEMNVSIVTTFKRKVKQTPLPRLEWEQHSEEDAHTEQAMNIHPEARVYSTKDNSLYQIEWRDETFTHESIFVCLARFRAYMQANVKESASSLPDLKLDAPIDEDIREYFNYPEPINACADDFQEAYGDYERGRTTKDSTFDVYEAYKKVCRVRGKKPLTYSQLVKADYQNPWSE